jgi:Flp pilus assembly protein TadD
MTIKGFIKEKLLNGHFAALLFSVAFLVRLVYLVQIQAIPFTEHLSLDASAYDRLARSIAGGDWLGQKVFYQAPLYPYLLAIVYKVFGHHLNLVRLLQLTLGAVNCVVIYWAARRLFDRKAAFWSGWLMVGYGIFVFYEGAIGKDGISVFATDLTLLGLLWSIDRRVWYRWFLSGAAFGLSILTRGNLLVVAPLLVFWIVVVLRRESLRRIMGAAAAFIAGTALFVLPVTLRNYAVGNDFVLTTAQAGQNFYIGNNPRASGFFENPENIRLNPKYEEEDFKAEALRRTGQADMKPSELSGYWFQEGVRFIRANPGSALKLLLRKTVMFWNHFEIPDNFNYYFTRQHAFILHVLFLSFGIIAPLGLLGLFLARRLPGTWLFALFTFGYMVSIVPFHMASRYRLPVVPVLILFAGYTVACAIDALKSRRLRRLTLGLVPVVVMAVLMNWKVADETGTFKAPLTDLGIIAAEAGEFEEAVAHYEEALEIDPLYAPALYNLGNALAGMNRFNEAAEAYRKALDADPEFLMAYGNLGKSYIKTGRYEEALGTFDRALARRPDFVEGLAGKALAYHFMGDFDRAARFYEQALVLQPDLASARYNLACAYARLGELEEARRELKTAIELNPEYEEQAGSDPDLENVR